MGRHSNLSILSGNSSVGRAQPCQGWGREFESRFPLQALLFSTFLFSVSVDMLAYPEFSSARLVML